MPKQYKHKALRNWRIAIAEHVLPHKWESPAEVRFTEATLRDSRTRVIAPNGAKLDIDTFVQIS